LGAPHLVALLEHHERLARTSDRDFDRCAARTRLAGELACSARRRSWIALWGAWIGGTIVGHIEVTSRADDDAPHRADLRWQLEHGIDRPTVARDLVAAAVAWSVAHPDLEWLDLRLRDDDGDGLAAARDAGFAVVGRVPDRFRIDGRSVGDILFARRVEAWRSHGVAGGSRPVQRRGRPGG
jgi:hypothetical protein